MDSRIPAFNRATGSLVWTAKLPSSARSTPVTHLGPNGKQYVVIAAGGHGLKQTPLTDSLVAFRLKWPEANFMHPCPPLERVYR